MKRACKFAGGLVVAVVVGLGFGGRAVAADGTALSHPAFSPDLLYPNQAPAASNAGKSFLGSSPWLPAWMAARQPDISVTSTLLSLNPGKAVDSAATFRFDLGWGTAHLSGIMREGSGVAQPQVDAKFGSPGGFSAVPGLGFGMAPTGLGNSRMFQPNGVVGRPSEQAFGIQGGLAVNLPQIAPGDALWLQAAFGHGASSLSGPNSSPGSVIQSGVVTTRLSSQKTDGALDASGNYKLTDSYSATAAFMHQWAPQWRSGFIASYTRFEGGPRGLPGAGSLPSFTNVVVKDANQFSGSASLIYSPVKDLDLGLEVYYSRFDPSGRVLDPAKPGTGKTIGFDDELFTRLRVERSF
jgi:hypothetical protein